MRNRLAESGILDAVPDDDVVCTPSGVSKLTKRQTEAAASSRPASESIAAWLDIAIKLCRLKEREASSLREELESHLSERINDMLVTGASEQQAIRRSIAELGDAAAFAQQYRTQRNEPTRRKIMNGLLIGGVGAALALSVTAVTVNQPYRGPNVYPSGTAYVVSGSIDDLVDFSFDGQKLRSVLEQVGGVVADRVYVNAGVWEVELDEEIMLDVGKVSFSHGILLLNELLDNSAYDLIDYRISNGLIEFGPRYLFDTRERVIVSYDTEEDLRYDVSIDALADAIVQLVDSADWVDNGGESASLTIVGSLMFVNAPPRMHQGVEWVIGQLSEESEEDTTEDSEGSSD